MLIDDAGRSLNPPKPGAAASMPTRTVAKPGTGQAGPLPEAPGFREFLARNQRNAMLAQYQWRPQTTDDTWAKMPQAERDKLTLLPTHTYRMTSFETNRLRQIPGNDLPAERMPDMIPGAAPREPIEEGALLTTDAPKSEVERVMEPTYSRALTWEQYDKLSDAERAVVDFNGDFLEARAKDFENREVYKKTATPEQRAKYDNDIASIFGGRGGSETYAPNVLSLLKSVDFNAIGQDLDEYLNLDRLISADEMKTLKGSTKVKGYGSYIDPTSDLDETKYAEIRTPENLAALDRMVTSKYAEKITKVMQDGYLRLKDVQSSMESARSGQTISYGGVGFNDAVVPGFPVVITPGSPEATTEPQLLNEEQQMGLLRRGVYEFAIDKKNAESAPMFQWLKENKLTESERSSLWEYVRQRLAQDKEYGVPEMIQRNIPERRTYDEVEKFLGMEG